jgi:hypothetical protein
MNNISMEYKYTTGSVCIVKSKKSNSITVGWTTRPSLFDKNGNMHSFSKSGITSGDAVLIHSSGNCALTVTPNDENVLVGSAIINTETIKKNTSDKGLFNWYGRGTIGSTVNPVMK